MTKKRSASLTWLARPALLPVVLLLLLAGLVPSAAHAAGGCAVYKSFALGGTVTHNDLNSLQSVLGQQNMVAACLDDLSATAAQMQGATDPYPGGTESLATTLQGELERLRYQIQQIHGRTYWYQDPSPLNPPGNIQLGVSSSSSAGMVYFHSESAFQTAFYAGSATASVDYTWPTAAPTANGQALTATTAGVMSWAATGSLESVQVFTSSDTWTRPAGITTVIVEVVGGGGGGGGAAASTGGASAAGSGGGGGGYSAMLIDVSSIATSTVTVGAAGAASAAGNANGGAGGASSWADGTNTVSATGGALGSGTAAVTTDNPSGQGGAGGTGSGGDINIAGSPGTYGFRAGGVNVARGGNGGASARGGGGLGSVGSTNGNTGGAYGGGGGGGADQADANTARSGGAGAAGVVIVWEFK